MKGKEQVKKNKKTVLVLASTFPRWDNDKVPPFVYELSKRLANDFNIHVLAPMYPGAKKEEMMEGMHVHRFSYFIPKLETLAGQGGIPARLKKNKLNYFLVPFFLLGEYLATKKLIKKLNIDIVHAHWVIPQGLIAYYLRKKAPYIVTSHGSDILGMKGLISLKKKILENAKEVTVVSKAIEEEIHETISKKIKPKIIPMGVDTKLFNPNKKDPKLKKELGIKGPMLLFVGRLSHEKGIDLVIDALPGVIKNKPNCKLVIIGEGPLKKELEDRAKELKVNDNIIFKGWIQQKDLPKYYATADYFIDSTLREGYGLTKYEAVSSNTQIVSLKNLKKINYKHSYQKIKSYSWVDSTNSYKEVLVK